MNVERARPLDKGLRPLYGAHGVKTGPHQWWMRAGHRFVSWPFYWLLIRVTQAASC
jgi:hypothetical protein